VSLARFVTLLAIVLALLGVGQSVAAEDERPPEAKPRVRVRAPAFERKTVVGSLIAIDDSSLTVEDAKTTRQLVIPLDEVTRIELSRRRSRRGHTAGIGALVGLGVGAALGYSGGDADCSKVWICVPREWTAIVGGFGGSLAGGLVGALVGRGEKWEAADPTKLQAVVAPLVVRGGGFGVSLSLRF
jgi:hypothetical protein